METIPAREPRAIFKYQKRYLYLELTLSLIAIITLIVSWIPTLFTQLAYGMILPSALKAAFFLTCTVILAIAFFFLILKEIRKIEIIITDERLIIKNSYKLKVILFSEITSIKFISLPLHRGFLQIRSPNTSMAIPLYIENMEGLVQAIATGLVRYGSLDIFDKKVIADINVAANIYKCSNQRARHALFPLLCASMILFFFSMIVSIHFWGIGFIQLLFWSCTSIFVPPLIFVCSDITLNSKMRKAITTQTATESSQSTYLTVSIVVFLCYFFMGWLFKSMIY